MTLHHEAIQLLREVLHEFDAFPAARLILRSNTQGVDYFQRGKSIVARADDLRAIEERHKARRRQFEPLAKLPSEHAVLEALINAGSALAQVGDGDSIAGVEAAAKIVEEWFDEHPDGKLRAPPVPGAGGPFAGELFPREHVDPADVGRRA